MTASFDYYLGKKLCEGLINGNFVHEFVWANLRAHPGSGRDAIPSRNSDQYELDCHKQQRIRVQGEPVSARKQDRGRIRVRVCFSTSISGELIVR